MHRKIFCCCSKSKKEVTQHGERGLFSLYGVGSQEAPHSPQKAQLVSVDMRDLWYHFSQLPENHLSHAGLLSISTSLNTLLSFSHDMLNNIFHRCACPMFAGVWKYGVFSQLFLLFAHAQFYLIMFLSYCSRPMCPPATKWRPPVQTPTVAATAVGEENSWVKLTCTSAASIRGPQTKTWSSSANREWLSNFCFWWTDDKKIGFNMQIEPQEFHTIRLIYIME